jgi:hypothetical protein
MNGVDLEDAPPEACAQQEEERGHAAHLQRPAIESLAQ